MRSPKPPRPGKIRGEKEGDKLDKLIVDAPSSKQEGNSLPTSEKVKLSEIKVPDDQKFKSGDAMTKPDDEKARADKKKSLIRDEQPQNGKDAMDNEAHIGKTPDRK